MKNEMCPKCGSSEIMAGLKVRDVGRNGHPLRVEVEEPEPVQYGIFWIPQTALGDLRAWVCSQCGYVELYINNLEELHKIYKLGK